MKLDIWCHACKNDVDGETVGEKYRNKDTAGIWWIKFKYHCKSCDSDYKGAITYNDAIGLRK